MHTAALSPRNFAGRPDLTGVWLSAPSGALHWDRRELFDDPDRPIEIDLGCGRGMFLVREAEARPEVNFIGVEWAKKYARLTAELIVRRGLRNARIVACDSQLMLRYLADGALQAAYILFPDPWWKRRHRPRRIVTPGFVGEVARVLRPGGRLYLATDVAEYFARMLETMAQQPGFAPLPEDRFGAAGPSTNFERKYLAQGRTIHRQAFERFGSIAEAQGR